jgi:site-specific DNA-cytosine methylase
MREQLKLNFPDSSKPPICAYAVLNTGVPLRVLVACEYSGTVRDAFTSLGFDAWSCDILPTEAPGKHLKCDVREVLNEGWDIMIAHPPCTYLSSSGLHWNKRTPGRQDKTEEALAFVELLLKAPIKHIAIENPIGAISSRIRKPEQIIQPYEFGHPESKATCLWLKNLPLLKPTKFAEWTQYRCKCGNVFKAELGKYGCCEDAAKILWNNQTKSGQNKLPPSKDRWKIRSKTYSGIAQAMAQQWSQYACI